MLERARQLDGRIALRKVTDHIGCTVGIEHLDGFPLLPTHLGIVARVLDRAAVECQHLLRVAGTFSRVASGARREERHEHRFEEKTCLRGGVEHECQPSGDGMRTDRT